MTRRSIASALLFAVALVRCSSFTAAPGMAADGGVDDAGAEPTLDAIVADPPDEGVPVVLPAGCSDNCAGQRGPCGVRVGPSCIDATEVTIADWRVFALQAPTIEANTYCAPVTPAVVGYRPNDDLPMTSVSYCEARAYCSWAGKQLCGHVGGGPVAPGERTTQTSLWYNACTAGGSDPLVKIGDAGCNLATIDARAARTTCQGGLPGLYDMIGNAAEWVDAVEKDGQSFKAYFLGGSYFGAEDSTCQLSHIKSVNEAADDLGFRCCSALKDPTR